MVRLIDIINNQNKISEHNQWYKYIKNPNISLDEARQYAYHTTSGRNYNGHIVDNKVYEDISKSPHVGIKYILDNIDYNWDWRILSEHPNITMGDINENPDLPWNTYNVLLNPNLTEEYVDNVLNKYNTKNERIHASNCEYCATFTYCSCHVCVFTHIRDRLIPINISILTKIIKNNNLRLEYVLKLLKKKICKHIPIYYIVFRNDVSLDMIIDYINRKIFNINKSDFFRYLSLNKNITLDFILKYKSKSWDWYKITLHPNITIQDIFNYDLPWNNDIIWKNPNVNINDILGRNISSDEWSVITKHPNITMEIIEKYPDFEWVEDMLRFNPNITIDYLFEKYNENWFLGADNLLTYDPIVYKNRITNSVIKNNFIIQNISQFIKLYI